MKSTLTALSWDTDFFKMNCAKLSLSGTMTAAEWHLRKTEMAQYDFIVIENADCNAENARLIGEETTAFLIDVNIRFGKKPNAAPPSANVTIQNKLSPHPVFAQITDFKHSRFVNDLRLARLGGKAVYSHWLNNAFDSESSFFAVYKEGGTVCGYILFSYRDSPKQCVLELVNVSKEQCGKGIGTALIRACENHALARGCEQLTVGTQTKNHAAVNFYHKTGFRQINCREIYHLWLSPDKRVK